MKCGYAIALLFLCAMALVAWANGMIKRATRDEELERWWEDL